MAVFASLFSSFYINLNEEKYPLQSKMIAGLMSGTLVSIVVSAFNTARMSFGHVAAGAGLGVLYGTIYHYNPGKFLSSLKGIEPVVETRKNSTIFLFEENGINLNLENKDLKIYLENHQNIQNDNDVIIIDENLNNVDNIKN
jgi:hypothetical protein